jgi:hypothetical protein
MNKLTESLVQMVHLHRHADLPGVYDVNLQRLGKVARYDFLECHLVLYPYSRQLNSDLISVLPFEEYVRDILAQQRSAYKSIGHKGKNIFGITLGAFLLLLFALFKPVELYSIESIVTIIGAYAIGKELWEDLENWLVNATSSARLRFQPVYYSYQLERNTTITKYFFLARTNRYGYPMPLPYKMDFIQQSNSQTVRMMFRVADLPLREDGAMHLLSLHLPPGLAAEFEEKGFLFGVKWGLGKKYGPFQRVNEAFQSFHGPSLGCLDARNQWCEGKAYLRETIVLGRLKWYQKSRLLDDVELIKR